MNEAGGYSRRLISSDLDSIAAIHVLSFHDSALSILGTKPTKKYYESLLMQSEENHNIGFFINELLVGFCFSGIYSGSLTTFIKNNKTYLIIWVLQHPWIIFNKFVFAKVRLSINILRNTHKPLTSISNFRGISWGVLAIAVHPAYQNKGIGAMLMEDVLFTAKKKGYDSLHLTVHPTNITAIKFYEKNGWQKANDNESGWKGLMRKAIN